MPWSSWSSDDDRRREAQERAPSAAGRCGVGRRAATPGRRRSRLASTRPRPPARHRARIAIVDRPASELHRARGRAVAGRRCSPRTLIGERLAGHGGEMRLDRGRQAIDPQLDPGVERRGPASLRRSWIARWSSRASPSARSSGVSSVSMTTTSPSSCATAVPGRGVARISTSSGASVTPAERHRAVGVDLEGARRAPRP